MIPHEMQCSEENSHNQSRIRPPNATLAEISESQSNARSKLPLKRQPGPSYNEPETKQRRTLERAGEPIPNGSGTMPRPGVKGMSIMEASQNGKLSRSNSSTSAYSSYSNRPPSISSRNTSNGSFASSVGPGTRNQTSTLGRSTNSRPSTSHSKSRHQTAVDGRCLQSNAAPDKHAAWDVEHRVEKMEDSFGLIEKIVNRTTDDRIALMDELYTHRARIAELEAHRTHDLALNTSLQTNLENAQQKVDELRENLKTKNENHEDQLRALRYQLDDTRRDQQSEVERMRRGNEDELDRLKRAHQEDMREMERRAATEMENRLRDVEKREASRFMEEQTRMLSEARALEAQAGSEKEDLSSQIKRMDLETQSLKGQIVEMKAELDCEQAYKIAAQKELADYRETMQRRGIESTLTIEDLQTTLASLRNKVHFLESGSKAQSDSFAEMEARLQEAVRVAEVSKTKLIKEEGIRRSLFNQVQELKGNIRVMCRVRPVLDGADEEPATISYPDDDKESKELELLGKEEKSSLGNITRKTHAFSFDRVFGPSSQNGEVFEEISQLVQSALDGYNVCIFCYGQTGSGKTHTMSSEDGMIPRATHQIYETAKNLEEKGWTYTMEGSFVEVYNEEIHDLLGNLRDSTRDEKKKHEIRHDEQKKQTIVTGLKTVPLDSPVTVETMLKQAAANRSVAATKSNERSSRSHSIFILKLIGRNSTTHETSLGTLNLVDLAGSERLKQSGAEGDRMKETQNINKSLSCLGDVIGALGQGKEGVHIPYRNSKLTYLLQYSLGGNSKTLMFVMASPLEAHISETLTSLKFATKVHNTHIGTAKKLTKVRD